MPHPSCLRVGILVCSMPKGLKRYYGLGHLHFLTFSLLSETPACPERCRRKPGRAGRGLYLEPAQNKAGSGGEGLPAVAGSAFSDVVMLSVR